MISNSFFKEERLFVIFRTFLGALFIWASLDKIVDPEGFARTLQSYSALPDSLVNPFALFLPWIEGMCGLLLVAGQLTGGCLLIIDILLLIFIVALSSQIMGGGENGCSCFAWPLRSGAGACFFYILRNFILLGIGLWMLFFKINRKKDEADTLPV